jgi:two-component system, NtrC family, sensor kinase
MASRRQKPKKKTAAKGGAPRAARKPVLKAPTHAAVTEAAFGLAKELSLELREEELVGTFAAALRRLLPGRLLCLRVLDPRSHALTSLCADGPLDADAARAPLAIKRSGFRRTRLSEHVGSGARVRMSDAYVPMFRGSSGGFLVPLVASGELFGALNVEYPPGSELSEIDEPYVIPLANQLSVALRNLALLGEAHYYRDYLRKLIDVANAMIIVIDRDANIAVMNAVIQKYCGLGPEVIGKPLEDVRKRSNAPEPRLATLLQDGLMGVEHTDTEVTLKRADGTLGRAMFSTSVLRTPDGSIDGIIGIGADRERVRSLERQVIQAEKLATLGQLAAGVVHELNNPLTSISVYGDYLLKLLEKNNDAADAEKARKIVEGASRIQKLTRDLISYARPSGDYESVAINEVVRQALTFCEHVLKRAEAQVRLDLAEDLPRLPAIRSQLHQVVINLVTNACHALPAPDQVVSVSTALAPDGDHLRITVADTGVGIDVLDREHIFEPFFTTKSEGKGTGLGLSIVKNIVERHGGQITFDSRIGAGTSFHILLPTYRTKENPQ